MKGARGPPGGRQSGGGRSRAVGGGSRAAAAAGEVSSGRQLGISKHGTSNIQVLCYNWSCSTHPLGRGTPTCRTRAPLIASDMLMWGTHEPELRSIPTDITCMRQAGSRPAARSGGDSCAPAPTKSNWFARQFNLSFMCTLPHSVHARSDSKFEWHRRSVRRRRATGGGGGWWQVVAPGRAPNSSSLITIVKRGGRWRFQFTQLMVCSYT